MKEYLSSGAALSVAGFILLGACADSPAGQEREHAAAIALGRSALAMIPGQAIQLAVTVANAKGDVIVKPVLWSTSDSARVRISASGVITSLAEGQATVTARVDSVSAMAVVTVYRRGLMVWPDTIAVLTGMARKLVARTDQDYVPLDGVRWASSDSAVARVDSTGQLTGVAEGHATLVATAGTTRTSGEVYVRTQATALRFTSVSVGSQHVCALTTRGAAYCWGRGNIGAEQLGDGQPTDRCESFSNGLHNFVARSTYRCSDFPVRIGEGLHFTSISAGDTHVCALMADGAAHCWGDNSSGALGSGTNDARILTPTRTATNVTFQSISAGHGITCAVSASNTAYCWGGGFLRNGSSAPSNVPSAVVGGLSFTQVDVGYAHACGITTANDAYCWGRNVAGELGVEGNPESCAFGLACSTRPVLVSGGLKFATVGAGTFTSCALTIDGAAYCWGEGNWGKLGNGEEVPSRRTPQAVSGSHTFTTLGSGDAATCALDAAGGTYCWGRDIMRADDTRPLSTTVPTRSAPSEALRQMDVGGIAGLLCGIRRDGITVCWSGATVQSVPGQ